MQEFPLDELDDLYQEVILDHYRSPKNRSKVSDPDISSEGFNPFCGDQVVLELTLNGDGSINQAGFQGQGCSISQASTSMLTELVKGKSLKEARDLSELFRSMMQGKELSEEDLEQIKDLEALQGVRKFPIRIKCALLAWAALEDGIEEYWAKAEKS